MAEKHALTNGKKSAMKKSAILILSIFSFWNTIFAQSAGLNNTLDDIKYRKFIESNLQGNSADFSNIMGSPYLCNDFLPGNVVTNSGTFFNDVKLRYNIYNDEIEFVGEEKKSFLLEKSTIKSVKIGDKEFIYKAYSNNNKIGRSYFEVLTRGKITLLQQYRIRFEEEQPAKAFAEATPAKFNSLKPEYYIFQGEQEAIRISNFKNLIELFPGEKTEIEKFIKANKLKANQEDISKIIEYYNAKP